MHGEIIKLATKYINIFYEFFLYILFISTALKMTVFRRCDAVYFGK